MIGSIQELRHLPVEERFAWGGQETNDLERINYVWPFGCSSSYLSLLSFLHRGAAAMLS